MVAVKVEETYGKATKPGRPKKENGGKFATVSEDDAKARTKAARQLNVSGRTVQDAKKVTAKAAPELVAAVNVGKLAVSDAVRVWKVCKTREESTVERR